MENKYITVRIYDDYEFLQRNFAYINTELHSCDALAFNECVSNIRNANDFVKVTTEATEYEMTQGSTNLVHESPMSYISLTCKNGNLFVEGLEFSTNYQYETYNKVYLDGKTYKAELVMPVTDLAILSRRLYSIEEDLKLIHGLNVTGRTVIDILLDGGGEM